MCGSATSPGWRPGPGPANLRPWSLAWVVQKASLLPPSAAVLVGPSCSDLSGVLSTPPPVFWALHLLPCPGRRPGPPSGDQSLAPESGSQAGRAYGGLRAAQPNPCREDSIAESPGGRGSGPEPARPFTHHVQPLSRLGPWALTAPLNAALATHQAQRPAWLLRSEPTAWAWTAPGHHVQAGKPRWGEQGGLLPLPREAPCRTNEEVRAFNIFLRF